MARVTQRKKGGNWQATVNRNNVRKSMTFPTKKEAEAWAAQLEAQVLAPGRGEIPPGITFGQLLERYRDEVVPQKDGAEWETIRIDMLLREDEISKVHLTALDSVHVARWRDRRLQSVQGSSVNREWTILSHACTTAIKNWKWLRQNPFKEASRPKDNPPRTRTPSAEETEKILYCLGCDPQVTPTTISQRVGLAYLFALETAMRSGEIIELLWSDINGRTAHLRKTKNGDARTVPLSLEAMRLLSLLPRTEADGPVFQLNDQQRDALFRKAMKKAVIEDLHFHDSRREALSRLSKKVDVLTLAKISGHRDLSILLNTYYKTDMHAVAASLD